MGVELSEGLFSNMAGWEAMKRARAFLAAGHVLSSNWTPPVLKGVVQEGSTSYRAGLVIKNSIDVENLCSCRASRASGMICPHSVAVGLHHLRGVEAETNPAVSASLPRRSVASVSPVPAAKASPRGIRRVPQGGEPCELVIIFPPNLDQAIARGRVMLVLEGSWAGGRSPLNALPKHLAYTFSPQDNTILDRLEELTAGETPAMLQLDGRQLGELLPGMAEHPRLTLGKTTPLAVTKSPWTPSLRAELMPSGEIQLAMKSQTQLPAVLEGGWILQGRTFQPSGLSVTYAAVLRGLVRLSRAQVPLFLNQDWPGLMANGSVEANFSLDDFTLVTEPPRFILELRGGLAQLSATLQCAYGARFFTLGVSSAQDSFWLPDPEVPTRYATRDLAAEQAAVGRLMRAGFSGPDGQGKYELRGQPPVLNFFAREFPRLQREWQVSLEERLERTSLQNVERIEPRFEVTSSGMSWFDLRIDYTSSGGERFSPADVQRLLLSGQSHVRLKNGKFALLDTTAVEELQETLLDCAPEQHAQGYRLQNTQAGFLEATLREHQNWTINAPRAWRERAQKLGGDTRLQCPPLGDLDPVLRPYQKTGVAWLQFLRRNGFGGILADEMGLGKTLQTLAALRVSNGAGGAAARLPSLIVCPTSLVFNWCAEAARFTPTLKVVPLHGPNRHGRFGEIAGSDLVITSYALIRRDADRHRELEYDTVVLDEAQHIKNRETQNAQAVKAIRSRHRLVLTGTPLENSVLDLWSIFDFLMPGYLGSAKDFRERYEIPITRHRDERSQARLARRLRPFMLRRLKREVAPELPAKLEQVAFCDLSDEQRAVYAQLLEASRREVTEAVGAQGLARSRMVILNALLRLRQVCCDLRLLPAPEAKPDMPSPALPASGKLELFSELLDEALDGGHRVLVFSQFVRMLTLLREHLEQGRTEYCYLDGSTTNRAEVVRKFQTDTSIPVFLISLKAGGVGLNLTGADTVIHFDPWWNPAVEDQATGRAHRIGQTRVVTSYKLITRETVEDKILQLQNRKREVIESMLGGEEQLTGALSWDEIQELFSA